MIVRRKLFAIGVAVSAFISMSAQAQETQWIRPDHAGSPPVWGIRSGIVVALWPAAIENIRPGADGGPRGLLRIGYEWKNVIYHINYIAIEPVVHGKMEFSEVSPSVVDGKWGKLMWAGETAVPGRFAATAVTRGVLQRDGIVAVTDTAKNGKETLSLYVFMEQFSNGAHPYLRLSISNDRPDELGIQIFHQAGSADMERCGITATMGNYGRLRLLHLKNKEVNAKELYAGYQGHDFIEKGPYPVQQILRNKTGDYIAIAAPDETPQQLASWPEQDAYTAKWSWRYRPFYRLIQYWRVPVAATDSTLQVRVNGRAKYWSGGSNNPKDYVDIPGGPAFENFELRERYYPGQQLYFGLSRKTAGQLLAE